MKILIKFSVNIIWNALSKVILDYLRYQNNFSENVKISSVIM